MVGKPVPDQLETGALESIEEAPRGPDTAHGMHGAGIKGFQGPAERLFGQAFRVAGTHAHVEFTADATPVGNNQIH